MRKAIRRLVGRVEGSFLLTWLLIAAVAAIVLAVAPIDATKSGFYQWAVRIGCAAVVTFLAAGWMWLDANPKPRWLRRAGHRG